MVRPSPVFLGILALAIGGGVMASVGDDPEGGLVRGGTFLLVMAGWGVTLCLHEFGHAIVAYRGGDREVYFKGYLTLDPRRYTDPVLSLVVPLVFLVIGGIPLPGGAVWINHYALKSKRVESLVSLAGPLSNLLVGFLLIVSVNAFEPTLWLATALSFLALLQVFAFVLNILPIPGLDGWGAIEPYLSPEAQRFGAKARPWAPLILFAALIGLPGISRLFFDISDAVFRTIGGESLLAAFGQDIFLFWRHL